MGRGWGHGNYAAPDQQRAGPVLSSSCLSSHLQVLFDAGGLRSCLRLRLRPSLTRGLQLTTDCGGPSLGLASLMKSVLGAIEPVSVAAFGVMESMTLLGNWAMVWASLWWCLESMLCTDTRRATGRYRNNKAILAIRNGSKHDRGNLGREVDVWSSLCQSVACEVLTALARFLFSVPVSHHKHGSALHPGRADGRRALQLQMYDAPSVHWRDPAEQQRPPHRLRLEERSSTRLGLRAGGCSCT